MAKEAFAPLLGVVLMLMVEEEKAAMVVVDAGAIAAVAVEAVSTSV